jgi:hypothetical protein
MLEGDNFHPPFLYGTHNQLLSKFHFGNPQIFKINNLFYLCCMSFYVMAWIIYLQFTCKLILTHLIVLFKLSQHPNPFAAFVLIHGLSFEKLQMRVCRQNQQFKLKMEEPQLVGICCTSLFKLLLCICSTFRCPFTPIWDNGHDGTRPLNSFLNYKVYQLIENNWHCSWYNCSWRWWIILQGFFAFGGYLERLGLTWKPDFI